VAPLTTWPPVGTVGVVEVLLGVGVGPVGWPAVRLPRRRTAGPEGFAVVAAGAVVAAVAGVLVAV